MRNHLEVSKETNREFLKVLHAHGMVKQGWYSDSLRAGRSGDRIPVRERLSAPVQTGPGADKASYTNGTGYYPGVKLPGRGFDHNPPHLVQRLKIE
jgi:hypothetical protein